MTESKGIHDVSSVLIETNLELALRETGKINAASAQLLSEAEEVRRNFRRLPELPGSDGPKPTIAPSKFAEILLRGHGDQREVLDLVASHRLDWSDANFPDESYGVWLDDLTYCIEKRITDSGAVLNRSMFENRLVPPGSQRDVKNLEDLTF